MNLRTSLITSALVIGLAGCGGNSSSTTGPNLGDIADSGSTMSATTPNAACFIQGPNGQTIQVPHNDPRKHDKHDAKIERHPVLDPNPPNGGGHNPPPVHNCPGKGHTHFGTESDPQPGHGCDS